VRSIFLNALTMLDLLFGWLGLAVLVAGTALLVAGFSTRFRVAASCLVIAIAICSGVALGLRMGFSFAGESWWLFTPALLSIAISGWNLSRERQRIPA